MSATTSYINSSDRASSSTLLNNTSSIQQQNYIKSKSFLIENINNKLSQSQNMKAAHYMSNQQQLAENTESQLYFNWASNLNFSNPNTAPLNHNNTNDNTIFMELEDNELWSRFSNLTNEMILTKAGRRTFPLIKLRMSGLDESCLYTIQIEFKVSDAFKYRFVNGEWRTTPRNDGKSTQQLSIFYEHTDSPNFGHHWIKESIAFGKLKLTNNEHTKCRDAVFLRSLNKYDPILHVYKHDKKNVDDRMLVFSKFFKQTQFIAVTAYQNENITTLKIKHNPFAKAFLNNKPTITIDEGGNAVMLPVVVKNEATDDVKAHESRLNKNANSAITKNSTDSSAHSNSPRVPNVYSNQDFIHNLYANYYNSNPSQNQPCNNYTDTMGYTNNSYGIHLHPYSARPVNDYFPYAQHQYNNAPYYHYHHYQQHQLPTQILGQQQYLNTSNAPHQDQPKQSSPIYDPMYNNKSIPVTAIRHNHTNSNNRMAPYSTTRPSKRNTSTNSSSITTMVDKNDLPLSVSPVYNVTKLDFEHTDDSLNLTENFMSQMHNQTIQSSNSSASTSSYALSSTSTSV